MWNKNTLIEAINQTDQSLSGAFTASEIGSDNVFSVTMHSHGDQIIFVSICEDTIRATLDLINASKIENRPETDRLLLVINSITDMIPLI